MHDLLALILCGVALALGLRLVAPPAVPPRLRGVRRFPKRGAIVRAPRGWFTRWPPGARLIDRVRDDNGTEWLKITAPSLPVVPEGGQYPVLDLKTGECSCDLPGPFIRSPFGRITDELARRMVLADYEHQYDDEAWCDVRPHGDVFPVQITGGA